MGHQKAGAFSQCSMPLALDGVEYISSKMRKTEKVINIFMNESREFSTLSHLEDSGKLLSFHFL
jgi:hypothetical protein